MPINVEEIVERAFEQAFAKMRRDRIQAVIVPGDALFFARGGQISQLAIDAHIAAIEPTRSQHSAFLMMYGVDLDEYLGRNVLGRTRVSCE